MGARILLYKVLGVLAGLVFAGYGVIERQEFSRLHKHGATAIVEPVENYTEITQRGGKMYFAEFHFKDSSGADVAVRHSFPEAVLNDFRKGVPVRIYYQRNDPTNLVFEKDRPGWLLIGAGVAVALSAMIFL